MKGLLLEEAYEVIDAVNARDFEGLEDELGDLLFLVVFYARLAEEDGRFAMDAVIEHLHAKLVRRHPHVFREVQARNAEEALASWLAVKDKERAAAKNPAGKSILDGLPASLPSTLEAYELGVRAGEVGFDWPDPSAVLDKIEEEVRELRQELASKSADAAARRQEELGDLFFAVANLARSLRTDPESCLRRANQKFQRRFRAMEEEIVKSGRKLQDCSLEEMEAIWTQVKAREAR